MTDISHTLAPKSDQIDARELLEPWTMTVESVRVKKGEADQPVEVKFVEFPRVWRPSKGMRVVLAYCWGKDSATWVGRRATIFNDPSVTWAGEAVGGIRIKALSHIEGVKKVPIAQSRNQMVLHVVEPLPSEPARPTQAPASGNPAEQLAAHYKATFNVTSAQLEAHVALPFEDWTPETVAALKQLGGEIKAGTKTVEDVFGVSE